MTVGQFGSTDGYMNYLSNNHVVLFNTDFNLSDRMRLYTQFSFDESGSTLGAPALSTDALAGTPPGFNYANVKDLGTFSDLRVRRFLQVVGFEHRFAQNWVTRQEFWWHDYKDGEPYLVDTNGRNLGFQVSLNYVF